MNEPVTPARSIPLSPQLAMDLGTPDRKAGAPQAWVLAIIGFLPIMAIVGLVPALPTLIAHFQNIPNAQTMVPLLLTAPGLCIALLSPVAGYLADRLGRRRLLLGAVFMYGVGGLLPFFLDDFMLIMAGRFLLGIAVAVIFTLSNVMLADYYTQDERPRWIALQGIIGPILGTMLLAISGQLAAIGWQWPFLIFTVGFIMFGIAWFVIWEPKKIVAAAHQAVVAPKTEFPWRTVMLICSVTLITSILYFVYTIHFSLVLDAIGIKDQTLIGRLSALASIGTPIGAYIYKRNANRPIEQQLIGVFLLLGVGLIGIGLVRDYRLTIAMAWIQQLGCGMTIPVLVGWSLRLLPGEHRGRGMGFWTSCLFIGQFVCPLVVSSVRSLADGLLPAMIVFGSICVAIALLILGRSAVSQQRL